MTGTAPPSPFFEPSTPVISVEHQTPGGTTRKVQRKAEVEEHKSGLVGCASNLINAIVGSGIVGIPYALRQSGFVAGILLVCGVAVLTEKSLRLLIATAKHVHCPSYETVAEAAFGTAGFRFVAINMLIMAYGAMLSYLMIVKESFSSLLGVDPDNAPVRRGILLLVSLTVQLPLSSKRDMADLAFTSRVSVVIDTVLVVFVALNAPISSSLESIGGFEGLLENSVNLDTLFVGLGVLSFAFVCQHSAFIIAGSLEKPTIQRWSTVTFSALLFCGCLAMLCGVCGYMGFLDDTSGNILNNLPRDNWSANVARTMLGITMLFVYPLESFVARHVCVVLLFAGRRAHEGDDSTILNRNDRRIGLTALLYLTAVVPAALFDDLGPVLAVTGAMGGSSLSYIGPGLVFLGVHGERFMKLVDESWLGSVSPRRNENTQSSQGTDRPDETTPLFDTQKIQGGNAEVKDEDSCFLMALKFVVWHLSGMAIWYGLAREGKRGLDKHAREMATKSPHPIRIGDVEYARQETTNVDTKSTVDGGPILIRHNSMGDAKPTQLPPPSAGALRLGKPPPSPAAFRGGGGGPSGGINQLLGKELLKAKKQKEKIVVIEKDPQENPATCFDFAIAIFYMLFGVVALFAGVLSLKSDDDSSEVHGARGLL